jgi:WS/DGAT/MGAT family acyltransferase
MASERRRRGGDAAHHERVSPVDTAWLRMAGPGHAMTILGVLATATPMQASDLRAVLAGRLLRRFPRFRQRPVPDALGAAWHDDGAFDLDAHLVVTRLQAPGGRLELQRLAARLARERLDPDRPLWQIHFVERYQGGSACVLRVHHCYGDGVAMVQVLLALTGQGPGSASDAADDATADLAPGSRAPVESPTPVDTALALATHTGGMLAELGRVVALPEDPPTPLRGGPGGVKQVAWSAAALDLGEVRTVARALGGTVNDVLLATVAGALGSLLRERHGFDTDALVLRASVPVNLRAADEPASLGNRFGLVFVDLPVGVRNPLERVWRVHDAMAAHKRSLQPVATLAVLGLLGMAPDFLQAPAVELFSRKGTLVASNVAGPQDPLFLCGQCVRELYFWVPQGGSIGIGVSLLSYAGRVFAGIIADRDAVPDPGEFVDRLAMEFERLLLATAVGVLARAEPGGRARDAPARCANSTSTAHRRSNAPAGNT